MTPVDGRYQLARRLGAGASGEAWLARDPQNVPGTYQERPNWLRKAEHPLEKILSHPRFADVLRVVDASRREA